MANERRASANQVDELHALQAATLMAEVKRYTDATKTLEDGTVVPDPQPVPPALLAQINKFLKDNGVDSPGRGRKLQDDLQGHLPDLEDVEAEHMGHA